jgi:hypothetical protein
MNDDRALIPTRSVTDPAPVAVALQNSFSQSTELFLILTLQRVAGRAEACARCDFYVPKESTKAQSIEAKANLLRLRQEIPLSEDELQAVEDGIAGHEKLVAKLVSCPTPASN